LLDCFSSTFLFAEFFILILIGSRKEDEIDLNVSVIFALLFTNKA